MPRGRPMAPLVLTDDEGAQLLSLANSRALPHGLVRRAQIVLACAQGEANASIAPRAGPSRRLRGQADTEPVGQYYAAAPVHNLAAVDSSPFVSAIRAAVWYGIRLPEHSFWIDLRKRRFMPNRPFRDPQRPHASHPQDRHQAGDMPTLRSSYARIPIPAAPPRHFRRARYCVTKLQ